MRLDERLFVALLLCASSAFAWPWSGSGEKKVSAEDQARIKDSLQLEEVRNLQREVDALVEAGGPLELRARREIALGGEVGEEGLAVVVGGALGLALLGGRAHEIAGIAPGAVREFEEAQEGEVGREGV